MLTESIDSSNLLSNQLTLLIEDDRGPEVATLQRLLVFYGYLTKNDVSGVFESTTDNAVRQFQHDHALYEAGWTSHLGSSYRTELINNAIRESIAKRCN